MNDNEINEAVARKLGWEKFKRGESGYCIPNYCHSIEAAWEIVEHLSSKQMMVSMNLLSSCQLKITQYDENHVLAQEYCDTAPKAICLAFLKLP